jgi:microcystin-dependent protein
MSDQFLGEIRIFSLNYAPVDWAFCNGQILPISQNTALFSIIGTKYGGNGTSNFALPNFQGAIPVGPGTGPGLSSYAVGQAGGATAVTLAPQENAMHTHGVTADQENATANIPTGAIYMKGHYILSATESGSVVAYTAQAPDTNMSPAAILPVGPSTAAPHNNMMPYLALNFCIAMQGNYPPRS